MEKQLFEALVEILIKTRFRLPQEQAEDLIIEALTVAEDAMREVPANTRLVH